jgi:hypothetical protein
MAAPQAKPDMTIDHNVSYEIVGIPSHNAVEAVDTARHLVELCGSHAAAQVVLNAVEAVDTPY